MMKRTGPHVPGAPASSDVDCAVDLHRLVASNAPRPTPVEAIPEQYMQMYWKPFFIPPEAVPPGGLADILARDFGHILNFQTNRSGEAFVTTKMAPDIALDQVARFHSEHRQERPQKRPKSSPKAPPVSEPVTVSVSSTKLSVEQEQSAQWLIRGLHIALTADPRIGEASSLPELRDKLQAGFFSVLQLPIVLCTGQLVDPIELVQKGQGKCFSRILQDPLSSAVAVKALAENPQFVPVVSLTFGWETKPQVEPEPPVAPKIPPEIPLLFNRLRNLMSDNMKILDAAMAKPSSKIPDVGLWKQALETLCGQEMTIKNILSGLV